MSIYLLELRVKSIYKIYKSLKDVHDDEHSYGILQVPSSTSASPQLKVFDTRKSPDIFLTYIYLYKNQNGLYIF